MEDIDRFIAEYFKGRRNGFVVDVGCSTAGKGMANSWPLIHDLDWSGVLIDALPRNFPAMQEAHRGNPRVQCFSCAIGNTPGPVTLHANTGDGGVSTLRDDWKYECARRWSHINYNEEITVECRRLSDVLIEANAPHKIDFLSTDTEGWELEVLRSMDWSRFNVELICVERLEIINGEFGVYPPQPAIVNLLSGHGFVEIGQTTGDSFFARTGRTS